MSRRKMKNNDVYRWEYKEPKLMGYEPYWCKSCIAIVQDGKLYDTFWGDFSIHLDIKKIKIKFQGNIDEMTEIHRWNARFYKYTDIVDMAHSNNSRAKIYIQPGTKRDKQTIINLIEERKQKCRRDIDWANRELKSLDDELTKVKNNMLDDIWIADN